MRPAECSGLGESPPRTAKPPLRRPAKPDVMLFQQIHLILQPDTSTEQQAKEMDNLAMQMEKKEQHNIRISRPTI